MDVVYILGKGSQWDDNELRYSLRSLQYIDHNRVFIVGERPGWLTKIHHIAAKDIYGDQKQKNAIHKLNLAISSDVSDDFILMNDDFFILRQMQPFNYYRQTLKEAQKGDASGPFRDALENTLALFPDGLDYSLHTPFVFNKVKLRDAIEVCGDRPMLLRTVYGNMHQIEQRQMDDVKLHSADAFALYWDVTGFEDLDCISTSDGAVLSERFQRWVAATYPEASDYELS